MNKFFIILLVLGSSLAGCTKYIKVELPPAEDELVVTAIFDSEDHTAQVYVNRTFRFDEYFSPEVDKIGGMAEVTLYKNGQPYATFEKKDETVFYEGIFPPVTPGDPAVFSLTVNHPSFPEMTATASMPPLVPLDTVEFLESLLLDNLELEEVVRIKFKDPPGEKNFYEIDLNGVDTFFSNPGNPVFLYNLAPNHLRLFADGEQVQVNPVRSYPNLTISDDLFDGKTVEWIVQGSPFISAPPNPGYTDLVWRNISAEQYRYISSVSADESGILYFITGNNATYNFDNGYGFFGLVAQKRYRVK